VEEVKNFNELPDAAFVRFPTIQILVGGAARQTIERWMREGKFPRGVSIGGAYRAWQVGEIRQYLAERQAAGAPLSVRSPGGRKGNRSMAAA
jgi:predicted DNA-binding transcriptional regulator AlpA